MLILGISALYHDSAAVLLRDGDIVAAAQEERFTRVRHDARFPVNAVKYCLAEAKATIADVGLVAYYEKPRRKFDRILSTFLAAAPHGADSYCQAMSTWHGKKLHLPEVIADAIDYRGEIIFPEHHESHAASAFFPSPFDEAAFLTIDGVGEWATTSYGIGRGSDLRIMADIRFPHSLGLLYSAFTHYTGFKVNSGEYKVMGLAPYGNPVYKDLILKHVIDVKPDGSYRLNLDYFDFVGVEGITTPRFHDLFGGPPRKPESRLTQREMDLARSVQDAVEEVVLLIAKHVRSVTGMRNLCLAGGVSLNCVANGKLLRSGIFDKLWIQPAAGDAGGALGAAYAGWHSYLGKPRTAATGTDQMHGSYLGPAFDDTAILAFLEKAKAPFTRLSSDELPRRVADLIASEHVIGWFQGRMEFGPRSLGARSIIGDARSPKMQETMNLKIKFRESFRPFAPSVLEEKAADYFELTGNSPYMLLVAPVRPDRRKPMTTEQERLFGIEKLNIPRSDFPSITHVDYSARIQTVSEATNAEFYRMIKALDDHHGCPIIVNTSFNVRGEPIVCTPAEAYTCFMRTNIDYLVLGNFILAKTDQPKLEGDADWRSTFALD